MGKRKKKTRPVNFKLIDRAETPFHYRLLDELVGAHHSRLAEAKIALAWRYGWNPDKDGLLTLGQCRKASDLDRELKDYDCVLLLNAEAWDVLTDAQRRALVDHELCHLQVQIDQDGDPVKDERGRTVYRTRKHDVGEFREIVARHGCYTDDLRRFAADLARTKEAAGREPLFRPAAEPPATVSFTGQDMAFVKQVGDELRKAGVDVEENVTVHADPAGHPAALTEPTGPAETRESPGPRADDDAEVPAGKPRCYRCGSGIDMPVVQEPGKAGPTDLIPIDKTVRSLRKRYPAARGDRGYLCGSCHQMALDEDHMASSA